MPPADPIYGRGPARGHGERDEAPVRAGDPETARSPATWSPARRGRGLTCGARRRRRDQPGIEAPRRRERLLGLSGLPGLAEEKTEVEVGSGVVRIDRDDLAVEGHRGLA